MFKIIRKQMLNPTVCKIDVEAPLVAKKAKAGQFIVLRVDENGERIPLTVADYDREKGTVSVIYQIVGGTTERLSRKNAGDFLSDFVGPLGNPTAIDGGKRVCIVGGGVGCAIALPVARAFKEAGARVSSVIGFRSHDLVILKDEFIETSDEFYLMTDDGSAGEKGNVCVPLKTLLEKGEIDEVITIGPLIMMKFVCALTKEYGVKTVASMNPIMIDGTGMCGCCRLTVGGKMKFACVDGPEFDGHEIDFDEALSRANAYGEFERKEREEQCNLFSKEVR